MVSLLYLIASHLHKFVVKSNEPVIITIWYDSPSVPFRSFRVLQNESKLSMSKSPLYLFSLSYSFLRRSAVLVSVRQFLTLPPLLLHFLPEALVLVILKATFSLPILFPPWSSSSLTYPRIRIRFITLILPLDGFLSTSHFPRSFCNYLLIPNWKVFEWRLTHFFILGWGGGFKSLLFTLTIGCIIFIFLTISSFPSSSQGTFLNMWS